MAAVLTGTPVAVAWAAGADPAAQNVTIPSDATAVYAFWAYYAAAAGEGLASMTLAGNAPAQTFEVVTAAGDQVAAGVAAWYNPATGSQSLNPAWDAAPGEGPTTIVVFVKDGDTTAWRDADGANETDTTACTVTLTTVAGDLVIKFDQRFSGATPPSLSAGWTNGQTQNNNNESARLSYISAAGTTQVCNSEDESYSSVVAISIPAGAAGFTLTADAGTYVLTGQAAGLFFGRALDATAGGYTLTGVDVGLTYSGAALSMTAEAGSYTLTGNAAGLFRAWTLTAESGAYVLTGSDALVDLSIVCESGAYVLTGNDATLTYAQPGVYSLTATAGTYTFTGNDAGLTMPARVMAAVAGSYALTGNDANLVHAPVKTLTAEAGEYVLAGQDVLFARPARQMFAEPGGYVLTGRPAALSYSGQVFTGPAARRITLTPSLGIGL